MNNKTLTEVSRMTREQKHDYIRELARRQGVKPIERIEDLQGDFWPEEESVDEFLAWVREIRQQDTIGASK